MDAKVILEITDGKLRGHRFEFNEHDTFLFGRSRKDCHAALPYDKFVSRHHFILEVNPPDAQIRDLGSLNGTLINGIKNGGREHHETPEKGAKRRHNAVTLQPGDLICVGDTTMRFDIETSELSPENPPRTLTVINPVGEGPTPTAPRRVVACQQCGENVADEVGPGRTGDYVCNACREKIASDPMRHLRGLIQAAVQGNQGETSPEIPGYRIMEKLGEGGMGVVYSGECLENHSQVAVKIMLSKIAVDEKSRAAFLRECEVLAHLKHPHIVKLVESGSSGTAFYSIMEYCDGGSLGDLMRKRRRLPIRLACLLILEVLKGLEYAHESGFVHRDIKPENILLHRQGNKSLAKLGDFGLAKNFENAGFSGMSVTGEFAGTYYFMPREQLTDFKRTRPVSDIWSVGATLYFLLTGGKSPRNFDDERHPTDIILEGRIINVQERNPQIPYSLSQVVDRSIADEPSKRFQSAEEMRQALSSVLSALKS